VDAAASTKRPHVPRRRWPERAAIPSAEARSLGRAARRTTLLRALLGAALAGVLALAFLSARELRPQEAAFVPTGTSGIVVLDVSRSIDPPTYRLTARVLERVVSTNTPVGFVAFSDSAYELLPPGSAGRELKPLIRFFKPLPKADTLNAEFLGSRYPANPWHQGFSAGTSISEGLRAAKALLARDKIRNGSIVLVSDLDTSPSDEALLSKTLVDFKAERLNLRVVPLYPLREDLAFFTRILGREAIIGPEEVRGAPPQQGETRVTALSPRTLAWLAVALALLLAANERWCGRLQVPEVRARGGEAA
jgi:hypothetical protein